MGGFHSGSGMGPSSVSPPSCSRVALWAQCAQVPWLTRTHQKMALGINSHKWVLFQAPQSVEVNPTGHQAGKEVSPGLCRHVVT